MPRPARGRKVGKKEGRNKIRVGRVDDMDRMDRIRTQESMPILSILFILVSSSLPVYATGTPAAESTSTAQGTSSSISLARVGTPVVGS